MTRTPRVRCTQHKALFQPHGRVAGSSANVIPMAKLMHSRGYGSEECNTDDTNRSLVPFKVRRDNICSCDGARL